MVLRNILGKYHIQNQARTKPGYDTQSKSYSIIKRTHQFNQVAPSPSSSYVPAGDFIT